MRTLFIKHLDFKTRIITTESFLINSKNKERLEQISCIRNLYSKYFDAGKPWKIPVIACSKSIITKDEVSYTEYCDNTVPKEVHEHERMHFIEALAQACSNNNLNLKTEMLVDFMACLHSNSWDESIAFYEQYSRLNKNFQFIIKFLKKAQCSLILLKMLDNDIV